VPEPALATGPDLAASRSSSCHATPGPSAQAAIGLIVRERRTLAGMATWPATADELTQLQQALGELTPEPWQPPTTVLRIGACFVCFERVHGAGAAGDRGFAGQRSPPAAGCWPE
jgi:hypothetical protein